MKVTCLKEDLLQVLSLINRISGIKTSLPFLGKVLLETKENFFFLKATNLEISLTAKLSGKIESEGSLLCSARLLGEYVNLLEQEKIELILEKNNLLIKTASSQAKVNIEEAKDFPSFPALSQKPFFSIPKSAFLDVAKKTTFATSQDLSKPVLSGVMLQSKNGRLVAVGTDGFRLSEMVLPSISEISTPEFEKVIVPAKTILEITHLLENHKDSAELLDFYLTEDKNQLGVKVGEVELLSRLLEADYPDYEKIIPQESQTEVLVEKDPFIKLLKTVAVFAPKEGLVIKMEVKENGQVKLLAEDKESGQGEAEIESEVKGAEVLLAFNSKFLMEGLNSIDEEKVRFLIKDKFAPVVINGVNNQNYRHLIMPIRLN